ncbi:hypothetical protein GCK72_007558 [Caenorhabditis remanei]|uniref:BTB domain-containing protein n=1 Tax=Caenorhabditis remanei TaxID=31234 RepID=A0A6A5HJE3_CAERE|nr:hypothetical protein GCK72_007558 [Caenorhabditis remanei]KAF1767599.1 hypothetical protein GCK72_007558 [Caenorhabditis remanei]
MSSSIQLDVGGTIFKTSKSTLTRFDGFFKTMLETNVPIEQNQSGHIFIDRDPTHFQVILNFMRESSRRGSSRFRRHGEENFKRSKLLLVGGTHGTM